MVRALHVITNSKFTVNKKSIHEIIFYLKKYFGFSVTNIEVNFVNLEMIKNINIEYLDHHYTTDIITLDYSKDIYKLDCEIFISYNVALNNAIKYKNSLDEEIKRLVIHGILHLVGYNDIEKSERLKMKGIENKLVKELQNIELNTKIYE